MKKLIVLLSTLVLSSAIYANNSQDALQAAPNGDANNAAAQSQPAKNTSKAHKRMAKSQCHCNHSDKS